MSMSLPRRLCACLCLSMVGSAATAFAQPPGESEGLTLAEALDRTLERNPELLALGFGRQGVEGQLQQTHFRTHDLIDITAESSWDSACWLMEHALRQQAIGAG